MVQSKKQQEGQILLNKRIAAKYPDFAAEFGTATMTKAAEVQATKTVKFVETQPAAEEQK